MRGPGLALLAALVLALPAAAQSVHQLQAEESVGINPRYLLQDPRGRSVTNEDFRGRFQLIAFGYTYCPDVCPTTLVEMAAILNQLGEQAERVQPIFITVRDSWRCCFSAGSCVLSTASTASARSF